ncbi:MAG: COQ9 family protein [Alphaproteobacteria bacterium]|nr:COQ9 family protein [Alphaproteobacteria bacterium]
MTQKITTIKDNILTSMLSAAPFEGWTQVSLKKATLAAGYHQDMAEAVFIQGVQDVVIHFADWADRHMLARLSHLSPRPRRIRDQITEAVWTRINVLSPYRDAERQAVSYWVRPFRKRAGAQILWKTSDVIWQWAGDESQDYNYYTKRTLLSGVLATTTLCALDDTSPDLSTTRHFLDRRIENVMQLGGVIGKMKTFRHRYTS